MRMTGDNKNEKKPEKVEAEEKQPTNNGPWRDYR